MSPAPPKSQEPDAPAATSGAPEAKLDIVGSKPICFHQFFWLAMYHSRAQRCGCCATRMAIGTSAAATGPVAAPATSIVINNVANLFIAPSLLLR